MFRPFHKYITQTQTQQLRAIVVGIYVPDEIMIGKEKRREILFSYQL
jgi:hypothetical protein